jgi:predicted Na+-dependent transporter
MKLFRILDPFTLTLVITVLLASFFPARGSYVPFVEGLTTAAIALLFFMHGAKLSREAIIAGGSLAAAPVGNVQHVHFIPDPRRPVRLVGTG